MPLYPPDGPGTIQPQLGRFAQRVDTDTLRDFVPPACTGVTLRTRLGGHRAG